MIQAFLKYKKPLLIIGILLLVFIAYSYWRGGNTTNNSALTSTETPAATEQNSVGQQFFNQLLTLKKINLNDQVFSSTAFQSLQDFSQPLPDEPVGRPNPFAPIGQDSGGTFSNSSTTNSSSTQR